jgi:hypothetical protein
MTPREANVRKNIASGVVITLIVVPYLLGKYVSYKANVVGLCLWAAVSLIGGSLAAVRPIAWFHLMGTQPKAPLSGTAKAVTRLCGVLAFLIGAMLAFNLWVNFSAYWNDLY